MPSSALAVTGVALAAAALGAVAACGGGTETDRRVAFTQVEVQAYLERETTRTLAGLPVGAASCPADLPNTVGSTTTCTVMVGQSRVRYVVQRLVADRFEARPTPPIVLVRDIATAVRTTLAAPQAQVQCNDAALVVQPEPGLPVTCQVTSSGSPRTAIVQVGPDGTITVTDP